MPRPQTPRLPCTGSPVNAQPIPTLPAQPNGSTRWRLSCRDASGRLTDGDAEAAGIPCQPAAFANRSVWPPVGLSVVGDPGANWMTRSSTCRRSSDRVV